MPRPTPREIRNGEPDLIQNITTLFSTLPFAPTAYTGGLVQGFGDTTLSSTRRGYSLFGYMHPGVDIPLPGKTETEAGTALLGLGDGYVTCGSEATHCGQQPDPTGNGHGIGIYYYSCDCVVYYSHALNVLPKFTNGKRTTVSAEMVVGYVGASKDGYVHLHLEIRNLANTMAYNPIYFFEPATWNSMGLKYQGYQNSYANPETRVYAIMMSTGFDYWNWEGSYPFVFVR